MSVQVQPGMRVAGDTNVGKVRTTNEDAMILDPIRGLYAVLDGMGGANAGDIASQTARDAMVDFVLQRRSQLPPKQLLEQAIQTGSRAVHTAASQHRERHGMGTTVVAVLVVDPKHVVVAHVGDSRCYLLRHQRLQTLTRDHTIVEELVDRGLLTADEAERHPYKNVLSRNLGARAETRVDVMELELMPGDRLLLCSDGLYGYASTEAIQYLLGSGDAPDHVARDLIELALRGGGGDNVSTIVLEAPAPPPTSTQVVRTTGASAWWSKRQKFLIVAKDRGLTKNPIVRGLEPNEALEVVALSLCQAVYHDLEKSTGVNVWTFAQNLAGGWFERGGEWAPVRQLFDILATSARVCVDEVRAQDPQLGFLLEVAVSRALVVSELALGGLLAERLRAVDGELIQVYATVPARPAETGPIERISEDVLDTGERFVDRPTIPFLRLDRPVTNSGISSEVMDGIRKTITIATARTSPRAELVKQILGALESISADDGGNFATAVLQAREIYGVRSIDDQGISPLFDALDQARIITAASVHQIQTTEVTRAKVLRALSMAHQRLVGATTGLVLEGVVPFTERLRELQVVTGELRDEVAKAERTRAQLESKHATSVDQSLPWGNRGTTEW
ncbi:MAG: Stp1/IreP family PP2C-type Ser/Thr phosphatase [Deltaproteobacteria bacterium]|nr:Stp1/IreP family PP2C-type Ser/Thr phosphatase [Deltaproteobacteria bacterium]